MENRPLMPPELSFNFLGLNTRRRDAAIVYARDHYGLDVPVDVAERIAQREMESTVLADSCPQFASAVRRKWLNKVRSSHTKITETSDYVASINIGVNAEDITAESYQRIYEMLSSKCRLFNCYPRLAILARDFKKYEMTGGFMNFLRSHDSRAYSLIRMFSPSWHLSARIDYLTGTIPIQAYMLHPDLYELLKIMVASLLRPSSKYSSYSQIWKGTGAESKILSSPLSVRYFMC